MTPPVRPRRSALFLPASNARAIAKARTLPADVVILDLEDSVAPDDKGSAREAAFAAICDGRFGGRELVVRVNALETPWGGEDLAMLARLDPDAVLAPKVRQPADIDRYAAALSGGTRLWAMIETAGAVVDLAAIGGRASETRLAGLVVGANDLAIELRARVDAARSALLPHLATVVAAGRAAGLVVLDSVCNDFADLDAFAAECAQGRALGFDGKTVIHPAQIAAANAAFAPTADELAAAYIVIAAFADPAAAGKGAIKLGGRMVERLHLAEAERIVRLAATTGH